MTYASQMSTSPSPLPPVSPPLGLQASAWAEDWQVMFGAVVEIMATRAEEWLAAASGPSRHASECARADLLESIAALQQLKATLPLQAGYEAPDEA
jgi:hypothetical protein